MSFRKDKKVSQLRQAIIIHVKSNIKEYISVLIIFLIGVVLGVVFVNNMNETQQNEMTNYIQNFITSTKDKNEIGKGMLLKDSIQKNAILGIALWFVGSTVIGIPLVYLGICFRGFCLGYTISSMVAVLGTWKGILFCISSTLLQSIIFIPCLLALGVSGIKLYKYIVKEKNKDNIKQEIYRHTIFSLLMIGFLLISSLIEIYVSTNLLNMSMKYL